MKKPTAEEINACQADPKQVLETLHSHYPDLPEMWCSWGGTHVKKEYITAYIPKGDYLWLADSNHCYETVAFEADILAARRSATATPTATATPSTTKYTKGQARAVLAGTNGKLERLLRDLSQAVDVLTDGKDTQ